MKRFLFMGSMLCAILSANYGYSQSNQAPVIQQSTSTTDTRQANPTRPKMKRMNRQQQRKMESGMDSTQPGNRRQPRLRPDSLRRGGATRVDSVRR